MSLSGSVQGRSQGHRRIGRRVGAGSPGGTDEHPVCLLGGLVLEPRVEPLSDVPIAAEDPADLGDRADRAVLPSMRPQHL